MRKCILIWLFLMALPLFFHHADFAQAAALHEGVLVRNITIEGFVLGDKDQFIKLFKPYRNKYLTKADMDDILRTVQGMYDMGGYKALVSISYTVVKKHSLVFTVLMTS